MKKVSMERKRRTQSDREPVPRADEKRHFRNGKDMSKMQAMFRRESKCAMEIHQHTWGRV